MTEACPQCGAVLPRRAAELVKTRLGATHPPTTARIYALEQRHTPQRITLDLLTNEAIDRELAPHRERVGTELVETYRDRLYA